MEPDGTLARADAGFSRRWRIRLDRGDLWTFIRNRIISSAGIGEQFMTTAETEDRQVVARRVFDALCARFPDKYVALIQPRSVADDQPLSGRAEPDPRPSAN